MKQDGSAVRVLIVEGDGLGAGAVEGILGPGSPPDVVVRAASVSQARELLRAGDFDVVVTDETRLRGVLDALFAFVGLFSESAARAVVSVPDDRVDSFLTMAASLGVPAGPIGRTGGSSLSVTDHFEIPLDELGAVWRATLPAAFEN